MRTWLNNTLKNDTQLTTMLTGGVHQGESMTSANVVKPFLVYTIGNATDEQLSEEPEGPERQFFQIYIHDEGADYQQIDDIIARVKTLLRNARDPESGIITVIYLETSRDLDDGTMGTILRYIRFVAIKEK